VLSEAEEQGSKPSALAEINTASSANNLAPGVAKYLQMYEAVAVSTDPVGTSA
jgi:hypothetical protein